MLVVVGGLMPNAIVSLRRSCFGFRWIQSSPCGAKFYDVNGCLKLMLAAVTLNFELGTLLLPLFLIRCLSVNFLCGWTSTATTLGAANKQILAKGSDSRVSLIFYFFFLLLLPMIQIICDPSSKWRKCSNCGCLDRER